MQLLKSKFWILVITLLFLASNLFLVNRFGIYYLEYLPLVLLFITVLFTRLDILFFSISFLVPVSLSLTFLMPGMDFDMSIPSEPVIISMMLIFIGKSLMERTYDRAVLKHPVSIAIYVYLLWMFVTCFTSVDPVVSFKYFLSRFWFIAVFYFFGITMFSKFKNIKKYFWLYAASMVIVIAYTFARHIPVGLNNQQAANWACQPFFNDHTAYGAALAMLFTFAVGSLFIDRKDDITRKMLRFGITALLLFAIIFSYTRATWLSLFVAAGVFVLMYFKIHFWKVFVVAVTVLALFFSFRTEIYYALQKNNKGASGDIQQHLQSMTNVSTDDSNLERLNRWSCALKMFEDKPFFGWGPGTYQFEYGAYQQANDITSISTFAGDLGNAHSEYLGPLAEQGFMGTICFILVLITSLYTGIMTYLRSEYRKARILAFAIVLGLVTYYAHGFLNNFLDSDKLSALFWPSIAMLVALNTYKMQKKTKK